MIRIIVFAASCFLVLSAVAPYAQTIQGAPYDATNVAIIGGSINGTTVGASTPSSGSFTTLDTSGIATFPNNTSLQFKDASGTGRLVMLANASNALLIRPTAATGNIALQNFAGTTQLQIAGSAAGGIQTGSATALTLTNGALGFSKITASGSAPGATGAKLELVCGTNAGTAKLVIAAGTSATVLTVTDNIGAGVTGC